VSIQVPKRPALLVQVETADEVGIGDVWSVVDAAAVVVPGGIGITWRLVSEGVVVPDGIGITWRLVSPAVVVPDGIGITWRLVSTGAVVSGPKPKQTVSRGAVID